MKILFVCLGNICRSPTAEGVFRAVAEREAAFARGEVTQVDSAGTGDWHVGDPPDRRTVAAARRRGYDLSRLRARQVADEDFHTFDLLLAMDRANLAELQRLRPAGSRAQVRLFLEYAPEAGEVEVPDPYYGGEPGFERVLDLCETAAAALIRDLRRR